MSGQILGDRYEVERQLGKKSGRWTLLAQDLMTDSPVILKLLFIDEHMEPDDLKLFKREVDTLQALAHPATPRYLGYFEIDLPNDGKALALIQSYMEGKSLQAYIDERHTLSEAEAIQVAKSILEILIHLHQQKPPIVHRDIKPSNILLSSHAAARISQVCLVDFGSVKSLAPSEGTTFSLVGTDGYIPPEQIGRRVVTASDLYSLGVTLVAAMTGFNPDAMPRRGFRIDLDQFTSFSPSWTNWLKKMIEPELMQRFRQADEALTALNSL
ncbi:serine/threonine protein kinase [Leptolyngbya sp. AN02str]|uniref:serine/threonine protein kinase n=1 Tax=Leptolyngbya sp. AN02str TaxID=3423363 RepID=UPI003D312EC0